MQKLQISKDWLATKYIREAASEVTNDGKFNLDNPDDRDICSTGIIRYLADKLAEKEIKYIEGK